MSSVVREAPVADDFHGRLEGATRQRLHGWVFRESRPSKAVSLTIECNDRILCRITANRFREDLREAGIGDGRHAFATALPRLSKQERYVFRVFTDDGYELPGSPVVLEPIPEFDDTLQDTMSAALAGLTSRPERQEALGYLSAHAQRLRTALDAEVALPEPVRIGADGGLQALMIVEHLPRAEDAVNPPVVLSHLLALQKLGYKVSVVAADELAPGGATAARIESLNVECCRSPAYASVEEVLRRDPQRFGLVYVYGASCAERYMALARRLSPSAQLLYNLGELQTLRFARQAFATRQVRYMAVSNRCQFAECAAASLADAVLTQSSAEASWLQQKLPTASIHEFGYPVSAPVSARPWAARSGLALMASFADPANVDAAQHFVERVLPLIRSQAPDFEFVIAGPHMPDSIYRLQGRGISTIGHLPDMTPILDGMRLTVAPQRFGAGVNASVLNSLAAGLPCIMTPVTANGLSLPPSLLRLVVEDASHMAALILLLHGDERRSQRFAVAGQAFVRANFNETRVLDGLRAALGI